MGLIGLIRAVEHGMLDAIDSMVSDIDTLETLVMGQDLQFLDKLTVVPNDQKEEE